MRSLTKPFLILCLISLTVLDACSDAGNPPLIETGGLEEGYVYSFASDKCGDFVLGKRYREALFAKLESCPFTDVAKEKFYRKIAEYSNEALFNIMIYYSTHAFSADPPPDAQCDHKDMVQAVKQTKEKIADYDAGRIKLADVIVNLEGSDIGYPVACDKLARPALTPPSPQSHP